MIGVRIQDSGGGRAGAKNREQGIGNGELVGSFFGAPYRVVRVRGTGVGGTFGRHKWPRQDVAWGRQRTSSVTLKLNERCGNVHENKGSDSHGRERHGDVKENKGSYARKAVMLLKTHMLAGSREPFMPKSPRLTSDVLPRPFRASAAPGRPQRGANLATSSIDPPRRGNENLLLSHTPQPNP